MLTGYAWTCIIKFFQLLEKMLADDDLILKVTATAICGSDLHIYCGKIPAMKDGDILGHEFMGIVEDTGPSVTHLKKGAGW